MVPRIGADGSRVVASALHGLPILVQVVVGSVLAAAELGLKVRRSCRRFRRRHADLAEQWRPVSRRTSRSLRAAVRGRRPIQPDEAALVVAFVDLSAKFRRARRLKRRKKQPGRVIAQYVAFLALAAYAIGNGDGLVAAVGATLAGYYGAWLTLVLFFQFRARRWNRHWPGGAADARADAVRVLAAPPLMSS